MRTLKWGIAALALVACAGTSRASDGIVDLSWNACAPVVQNVSTTTQGQYSIYVSVLGIDMPHEAYEVAFMYGNISQVVPDAWRFDPFGCQTSALVSIDHLAPAADAATCPSFQGAAQSIQIKDVRLVPPGDPSGFPLTNMRVLLDNAYAQRVVVANPATRYFLMRVLFDHSYSGAGPGTPGLYCGGFEQSMCFKLARAYYLDPDGAPHDFGRHGGPTSTPSLSFNGPAACAGATPAQPSTWGRVKNQYR
jgi:hypothetical protein